MIEGRLLDYIVGLLFYGLGGFDRTFMVLYLEGTCEGYLTPVGFCYIYYVISGGLDCLYIGFMEGLAGYFLYGLVAGIRAVVNFDLRYYSLTMMGYSSADFYSGEGILRSDVWSEGVVLEGGCIIVDVIGDCDDTYYRDTYIGASYAYFMIGYALLDYRYYIDFYVGLAVIIGGFGYAASSVGYADGCEVPIGDDDVDANTYDDGFYFTGCIDEDRIELDVARLRKTIR